MTIKSAIYSGFVEHRRLSPKKNIFQYSVCYYFLNLDEVKSLFRVPFIFSYNFPGILSFWRKHYIGLKTESIQESVKKTILASTQESFEGKIFILTNISYFGFCFNPVSFYYCYSPNNELQYVVSEITNTPWGERHSNVFKMEKEKNKQVFKFPKDFHVSPFMPMSIDYTWVFHDPSDDIFVYMQDRYSNQDELIFDSTLKLKRKKLSPFNIFSSFINFPFVTFKTMAAIYYQAAKLYVMKVPFHTHPSKEKQI